MGWKFDEAANVACITCRSVMAGHPVLVATHYEEDHSWAFTDGAPIDMAEMRVVSMANVVDRHPDLEEISSLPPGWTATRSAVGELWLKTQDDWEAEG